VVLKLLSASVMPLGILTVIVLAVILFGITTATESAAVGAAGAFLLAFQARTLDWKRTKEAVFLTAKTTAMVCWLFVGSALFSAVFAILGGQGLIERWTLSLDLTPLQFMLLSQAIIFVLGWPLEWTEIIIIFVPIFLPLLKHYNIDPILWGTLVFVNLQAAFLSPPVAMSAFYLKGVSPPHVTINQIFGGMMPYMLIVILCMVIMYSVARHDAVAADLPLRRLRLTATGRRVPSPRAPRASGGGRGTLDGCGCRPPPRRRPARPAADGRAPCTGARCARPR
jgi:TRAP-type mannitol/chloroaromatic compound transport system permease large subunit